jgi:hypothetical protein
MELDTTITLKRRRGQAAIGKAERRDRMLARLRGAGPSHEAAANLAAHASADEVLEPRRQNGLAAGSGESQISPCFGATL